MQMEKLLKSPFEKAKDVAWNFGAFAVQICAQQLLIMPYLAKRFSEDVYSQAALFLTIFNIVVCVAGDELGNTYLIRKKEYEKLRITGDFFPIFAYASAALIALGIALNIFFVKFSAMLFAAYATVFICGVFKFFLFGYLKGGMRFPMVFSINAVYAAGAIIGVMLLPENGLFLVPFLCGELPASLLALIAVKRYSGKDVAWRCSPQIGQTAKDYAKLSFSALLIGCTTYLDRLLVYPRLGATAMSLYYSGTTMSKLTSMAINPISGVILARLSNRNQEDSQAIARSALISWPILVGAILALNLTLAPVALNVLYNQFFESAVQLIVPISIAGALSGANYLIKPAILKLYSASAFLVINLIYAFAFIACLHLFSTKWGLMGYAVATAAASAIQSVCYLFVLLNGKRSIR